MLRPESGQEDEHLWCLLCVEIGLRDAQERVQPGPVTWLFILSDAAGRINAPGVAQEWLSPDLDADVQIMESRNPS